MAVRHLRIEEPVAPVVKLVEVPAPVDVEAELQRWRKMAVDAGERLAYAENQLKDLRQAADDARARFSKYKSRLDGANERVNDLQAQLIAACHERDTLKARLVQQDIVKQKVWEYRQSLIDGPLFELFGEYCK